MTINGPSLPLAPPPRLVSPKNNEQVKTNNVAPEFLRPKDNSASVPRATTPERTGNDAFVRLGENQREQRELRPWFLDAESTNANNYPGMCAMQDALVAEQVRLNGALGISEKQTERGTP